MKKAKYVAMVIIGILTVAGALVSYRFNLAGVGGGLMGGGIVMLVLGITRLSSEKAAKEAEIEVTDERNKTILHAASYYAASVGMFALVIIGVIFGELGEYRVMGICFGILFLEFITLLIAKAILSRKI